LTTEPFLPPDEAPFIPPFEPGATVKPRTPRTVQAGAEEAAPSRTVLWTGIGIAGGLVLIAAFICVWLFSTPTKKGPPPPPPRKPIYVNRRTAGGLTEVLRSVQDGDRVIIEVDLEETDVFIRNKSDITIEGAPGKKITWKAPAATHPASKLLTLGPGSNVTIRNIRFEGANKPMALVQLYSDCEGLKMEDIEFDASRLAGLLFVSAAGTAENRMSFKGLKFNTLPNTTAIHFMTGSHKTILQDDHIIFSNCTFAGAGHKVTRQTDGDIGKDVTLPEGVVPITWPLPK
jgi:hypothetical protein